MSKSSTSPRRRPPTPKDVIKIAPAQNADEPSREHIETLLGSDALASTFEIGGETVQLGTLVAAAHQVSGLTGDAWNALPDAERDALIGAELARRQEAALDSGRPNKSTDTQEPKANGGGGNPAAPAARRTSVVEAAQAEVARVAADVDKLVAAGAGDRALALLDERLDDVRSASLALGEMEKLFSDKRAAIGGDEARGGVVKCWTKELVRWSGKEHPIGAELHLPLTIYTRLEAGGEVTGVDPSIPLSSGEPSGAMPE